MRRILITNAKGGCGKSTLATNLASAYASKGYRTALFDYDEQLSSLRWLRQREKTNHPPIHGINASHNPAQNVTRSWLLRVPDNTERAIIDTPAGLKVADLLQQLQAVDDILVPVLPSPIDIQTTADFIRDLLLIGKVRERGIRLGIVANRVRINTLSFRALERFLKSLDIPVIARLRDTQNYTRAAEQGCGIQEIKSSSNKADILQWDALTDWIEAEATFQEQQKHA
ncbi:ParA family protein [Sulfuriflexus mobilis]|uniref:ParA family protein n=1 Tax=Sulfuriflexus mobilis TaxID=1811807 RepID=UPI000F84D34C|nr:ParA family protein [Sulfuriflexus mobilis]